MEKGRVMSRVFMISDLHLGHKAVLKFSKERTGETIEEHDEWLRDQWNSVVYKRDLVYVLGDVAMSRDALKMIAEMNGQKTLIMGNHDKYPVQEYLEYFERIRPSPWSYKGFWLSHCPIHPLELRGRGNIHGHVHSNPIPDSRYVSVCVEALDGIPKLFTEIKEEYANIKHCSKCDTSKQLEDFSYDKHSPDGRTYWCKTCASANSRMNYAKRLLEDPIRTKLQKRESRLKSEYGLTLSDYEELLVSQEGRCKICRVKLKPGGHTHIDHCHTKGDVRGLLCTNCNRGLGHFQDSTENLTNAIKYLGDHSDSS